MEETVDKRLLENLRQEDVILGTQFPNSATGIKQAKRWKQTFATPITQVHSLCLKFPSPQVPALSIEIDGCLST